jgi:PAS domain-containing protein
MLCVLCYGVCCRKLSEDDAKSDSSREQTRKQKHSEVEHRRRHKIRQQYLELHALCITINPILSKSKQDHTSTLSHATTLLKEQYRQAEVCKQNHQHCRGETSSAHSVSPPYPTSTGGSTASFSATHSSDFRVSSAFRVPQVQPLTPIALFTMASRSPYTSSSFSISPMPMSGFPSPHPVHPYVPASSYSSSYASSYSATPNPTPWAYRQMMPTAPALACDALSSSIMCWVVFRIAGSICVANPAALSFLQIKPEHLSMASPRLVSFLEKLHHDDVAGMYQDLSRLLQRACTTCAIRFRIRSRDNTFVMVNALLGLRYSPVDSSPECECVFMPA